MFILAVVVTVLLLMESLPSAGADLTRSQAGRKRLDELTRVGVLDGRNLWVMTLLGVIHLVGSSAALDGLWRPAVGVAGGGVEALVFGWTLYRQLSHGDRGRGLFAYLLFSVFALAVLAVDLARV